MMEAAQRYANSMQEPVVLYRLKDGFEFYMTLQTWNSQDRSGHVFLGKLMPEPRSKKLP